MMTKPVGLADAIYDYEINDDCKISDDIKVRLKKRLHWIIREQNQMSDGVIFFENKGQEKYREFIRFDEIKSRMKPNGKLDQVKRLITIWNWKRPYSENRDLSRRIA